MNEIEQDAIKIAHAAEAIVAPIGAAAAIAVGDALLQAAGTAHLIGTYAIALPFVISAAVALWQAKVRPWLARKGGTAASGVLISGVGHLASAGTIEAVALPALPIVDPVLVTNLIEDALRQHLAQHATAETPPAS